MTMQLASNSLACMSPTSLCILCTLHIHDQEPISFAGSEDEVEDPDEGQEEARAALRAAKRARGNGRLSDTAMLNAMEAAEKQHDSKSAQGKALCHPAILSFLPSLLCQRLTAKPRTFAPQTITEMLSMLCK